MTDSTEKSQNRHLFSCAIFLFTYIINFVIKNGIKLSLDDLSTWVTLSISYFVYAIILFPRVMLYVKV